MKPAIRTTFLIFLVFAAFSKAETIGNSSPSEAPSLVTISVFDRANVPTELLTVAEEEARRIFLHAGVETTWLNCSKPLAVRQSKAMSRGTIGAGYLVVEILPRANSEQLRFRLGVLGTATLTDKGEGFYCYFFTIGSSGCPESDRCGLPGSGRMVGKQEVIAKIRAIFIDPSQKINGIPWSLCASVGLQSKKRFRTINVESSPFSHCSPLSRSEGKMKSSKFRIHVVSNVVRGQFGEPQIRRLEEACGAALES